MPRARRLWIALTAVSLLASTACAGSSSGASNKTRQGRAGVDLAGLASTPFDSRVGKPGGTFRMAIAEPVAIDPSAAQEPEGVLVAKNLFDPLTTVTSDGKVRALLASSYSSDRSCAQWTFNVKRDQKFSNGETVDAESVKRGLTRAVAPGVTASTVAYQLADIKGFQELHKGLATDLTGVSATGLVLKIALTAPDCEFNLKTAQPAFSPVPLSAGAANNAEFNAEPVGNGPFKLAAPWDRGTSITLVRNDSYTDGPKPLLARVVLTIIDTAIADYEDKIFLNGGLDYARVVPADLKTFAEKYQSSQQSRNNFIKAATHGINYLSLNGVAKPLASVQAREAISYAIDRSAIIKGILKDSQLKATSLVGPAFSAQGTYQPGMCESCIKPDPAKAKDLAQQAHLPAGTQLELAFQPGGGNEGWMQAVAGELEATLGWKVTVRPASPVTLAKGQSKARASSVVQARWSTGYPSASGVLKPLLGTQPTADPGQNAGRYSNPQVDGFLARGQAEPRVANRAADYRAAEKIAIGQHLALIPLWYETAYRVFSPRFVGVNEDCFTDPTLRTIGLA